MTEASDLLAGTAEGRLRAVERRGLWYLLLNLLGIFLLALGLVELLYPQTLASLIEYRMSLQNLSLVLFGFLGIILMSNLLALSHRASLRKARGELVKELARHDAATKLTLVDPVTGTFDRRYLDEIIPRETNRADRRETTLCFIKFSLEGFEGVDSRLGYQASDRILQETAQMLKKSFRPTDIIVRYGSNEFLVMMPETAKHGAMTAVRRLLTKVDEWNRKKPVEGYELELSVGLADYTKGKDVRDAMVALDTRVQLFRDQQTPGA